MGTGMFLTRLRAMIGEQMMPFGLDLSQKMIDGAYLKIPDLQGAVDTAANLDAHFPEQSFDLICTHFISGFVPLDVLAPKVYSRLEEGGYWSYLGATKGAYPHCKRRPTTNSSAGCSAANRSTSTAWCSAPRIKKKCSIRWKRTASSFGNAKRSSRSSSSRTSKNFSISPITAAGSRRSSKRSVCTKPAPSRGLF